MGQSPKGAKTHKTNTTNEFSRLVVELSGIEPLTS